VFYIVYLGLLIPLCIQIHCYRLLYANKKSPFFLQILIILITLLVVIIGRWVDAYLFVEVAYISETITSEAILSYWLPYIIDDINFTIITLIIFLWLEILRNATIGGRWKPKLLKIVLLVANGVLYVGSIVALCAIRPFGRVTFHDPYNVQQYEELNGLQRGQTFGLVYFILGLVCLIVLVVASVIIYLKVRNVMSTTELPNANEAEKGQRKRFRRKTEFFLVANLIIFVVKIALDEFTLLDTNISNSLLRSLQLLWNTVPELALGGVFLWIIWKKPSEIRGSSSTSKETSGSGSSPSSPKAPTNSTSTKADTQ